MNILRWKRKSKKKIKFKTLILFVFSLIMTTFAWFAYSKVLNTSLNLHLASWDMEYYIAGVKKTNPIPININTLYPTMPEQAVTVDIKNNGETLVDIEYQVKSVTIIGTQYEIIYEGQTNTTDNYIVKASPVLSTDLATGKAIYKDVITNDISKFPFTIEVEHSAQVVAGGQGYLKVTVNWIGDNNELDSEWGYRVGEYFTNNPTATTAMTIELSIDSYQANPEGEDLTEILPSTLETAPYLPTGFTRVPGTNLDTGLVITDSSGNEYVWVEVPKNDIIYATAGPYITEFTNAEYTKIETDLKTYSADYNTRDDAYSSFRAIGIAEDIYKDLKKNALKSIYQNGGFYIGRYETGIENSFRTTQSESTPTETAVIKPNAYPFNYVTCAQAQEIASNKSTTEYTNSLMFGFQWDLVMKYLQTKSAVTGTEINTDSTAWGNYNNNKYNITKTNARYSLDNGANWLQVNSENLAYEKTTEGKTILTTGSNSVFSKQNIYDLAGNMAEWTLNVGYNGSTPVGGNGGDYYNDGTNSASHRSATYNSTAGVKEVGFRIAMFSKVHSGAVGNDTQIVITYDANGGIASPADQPVISGEQTTLSTTVPTREGYNFLGWATTPSATSKEYDPGANITTTRDITLYAVWQGTEYTVTYSANGGNGAPVPDTKIHGTDLILSTTVPTRDGYNFLGWATTSTATSKEYDPGGTFTTDANTILYAVWQIKTYTVVYSANGGSGAPAADTKIHGVNLTLSSTIPSRTGYDFLGWSIMSAATTKQYDPGGTFTTDANTTLFAVWELNGESVGELPSTTYTTPYMPTNFHYVEGDLDNGLVIADALGNEYVWVEVPTTLYDNVSYNTENTEADRKPASSADYNDIEYCLKKYTNAYRNGTTYKDEFYSTSQHGFADADAYNQQKYKMLKSVYENGGFYVGRYETGIESAPKTSGDDTVEIPSETPVIKKNVYPYNHVTNKQAQKLASTKFDGGGHETSLMFGVQWDLVLKYMETKAVEKGIAENTIKAELNTDSTNWGNYENNSWIIENTNSKYSTNGISWTNGLYNGTGNKENISTRILLSTGADTDFSKQNIYDMAGNVYEWTLEYNSNPEYPCVRMGGGYDSIGSDYTASSRAYDEDGATNAEEGFRITLY